MLLKYLVTGQKTFHGKNKNSIFVYAITGNRTLCIAMLTYSSSVWWWHLWNIQIFYSIFPVACPSQDVQIISLHNFFPVTNLPTVHFILNFSNYVTWPPSGQSLVYLLIDINKPRWKNRSSSIFQVLTFDKDLLLTCQNQHEIVS